MLIHQLSCLFFDVFYVGRIVTFPCIYELFCKTVRVMCIVSATSPALWKKIESDLYLFICLSLQIKGFLWVKKGVVKLENIRLMHDRHNLIYKLDI